MQHYSPMTFLFVFQLMIVTIKILLVSSNFGPFSMLRILVHPCILWGALLVEPSQTCRQQIVVHQMKCFYFNKKNLWKKEMSEEFQIYLLLAFPVIIKHWDFKAVCLIFQGSQHKQCQTEWNQMASFHSADMNKTNNWHKIRLPFIPNKDQK